MKSILDLNTKGKMSGKEIKDLLKSKELQGMDKEIAKFCLAIYPNLNDDTLYKVYLNEIQYNSIINENTGFHDTYVASIEDQKKEVIKNTIRIVRIKDFSNLPIHDIKYYCNLKSFIKKVLERRGWTVEGIVIEEYQHQQYIRRVLYVKIEDYMYHLPIDFAQDQWILEVLRKDYGIYRIAPFMDIGVTDCIHVVTEKYMLNDMSEPTRLQLLKQENCTIYDFKAKKRGNTHAKSKRKK